MAAAIKLKQSGHQVELVEKSEDWKALGTGLTLSVLTLVSVGAIPNTELAEQAGIQCENGVVVNTSMQTNFMP